MPSYSPTWVECNISFVDAKKLDPFASTLKRLTLKRLRQLRSIPKLPPELEELTVENCDKLTRLPKLPKTLKRLVLHRNDRLTGLASIPAGMTEIEISCCPALEHLPVIPTEMEKVTILTSPGLLPAAKRANFYVLWGDGAIYFSDKVHPFKKLVRDKADLARITY